MTTQVFDVFVVGATDPAPGAQARLAAGISTRMGIPLDTATRGIAEKKLRVGQRLSQDQAQALVREMRAQGAATVVRGSAPPGSGNPDTNPRAPDPFAPPPSGPSLAIGGPGAAGGGPGRMSGQFGAAPPTEARDPFGPGLSMPGIEYLPTLAKPQSGKHPTDEPPPLVGHDPFGGVGDIPTEPGADGDDGMPAGLARGQRLTTGRGAAADPGGVGLDEDAEAKMHTIRCPKHGLYYDKRKASGCLKCLEVGHKLAADVRRKDAAFKIADYDGSALKRALVGTALALFIGFLPAAFMALRVGQREVRLLRDDQAILSRRPGTETVMAEFDQIEGAVRSARTASLRNTALVWIAISGISLAAWYRLTAA